MLDSAEWSAGLKWRLTILKQALPHMMLCDVEQGSDANIVAYSSCQMQLVLCKISESTLLLGIETAAAASEPHLPKHEGPCPVTQLPLKRSVQPSQTPLAPQLPTPAEPPLPSYH